MKVPWLSPDSAFARTDGGDQNVAKFDKKVGFFCSLAIFSTCIIILRTMWPQGDKKLMKKLETDETGAMKAAARELVMSISTTKRHANKVGTKRKARSKIHLSPGDKVKRRRPIHATPMKIWDEIPQSDIRKYIRGYGYRLQTMIDNDGEPTSWMGKKWVCE